MGISRTSNFDRRSCASVAWRRAKRLANKRGIPRSLWPLIAAIILIGMIFERRASVTVLRDGGTGGARTAGIGSLLPTTKILEDVDRVAASSASDSDFDVTPKAELLPSPSFLLRDATQSLAFIIRNRGRLDTDTVRAKWEVLDRVALPLAVYIRQVEASAAWNDLEREIGAVAPKGLASSETAILKSPRHRALLELIPEWSRRGTVLLSRLTVDALRAQPEAEIDLTGPEDEPPKP